jgi:hypothetical protein
MTHVLGAIAGARTWYANRMTAPAIALRSDAAPVSASRILAASRIALGHAAAMPHDAELWVSTCADDGVALGAFQRARGLRLDDAAAAMPRARRGSGGPAVLLAPETLHVALVLSRVDALTDCDAPRLVNRYVRPLLRGLTRAGFLAHYFDRDWVSVARRPAAWVGFAHDATTGCAVVEAFVATRESFAPDAERASFLGKVPVTLEEVAGHDVDVRAVIAAIEGAYAAAYGRELVHEGTLPAPAPDPRDVPLDPPWLATVEETIGTLGAGPDAAGAMRVGGDLLASADAILALERALAAALQDTDAEIARMVDEALDAPGVTLFGVRERASLVDVIRTARERQRAR